LEITRTTKAWTYESIMLYREDLDEIIGIFKTSNPNSIVSIEDDQTPYPSLDEMRVHNGDRVANLRLVNEEVGIKLQLREPAGQARPLIPTLATTKVSDEADLVFYRCKEFLESKKRISHYWATTIIPVSCIIILVVLLPILFAHRHDELPMNVSLFVVMVTAVLATANLFLTSAWKISTSYFVNLKRRHERQSFLSRNRDGLIVNFIFLVVGVLLTLFFQYLHK
jgi:hypothetical protein